MQIDMSCQHGKFEAPLTMMIGSGKWRLERKRNQKETLLILRKNKKQVLQLKDVEGAEAWMIAALQRMANGTLEEAELKHEKEAWIEDRMHACMRSWHMRVACGLCIELRSVVSPLSIRCHHVLRAGMSMTLDVPSMCHCL